MLLQEGGHGQYHLRNLVQHMETSQMLVTIAPTKVEVIIIYPLNRSTTSLAEEDFSPPT